MLDAHFIPSESTVAHRSNDKNTPRTIAEHTGSSLICVRRSKYIYATVTEQYITCCVLTFGHKLYRGQSHLSQAAKIRKYLRYHRPCNLDRGFHNPNGWK